MRESHEANFDPIVEANLHERNALHGLPPEELAAVTAEHIDLDAAMEPYRGGDADEQHVAVSGLRALWQRLRGGDA